MNNVITFGKLIGLLLFCLLLHLLFSINMHTNNTRNELTRFVMGTILLVNLHVVCSCLFAGLSVFCFFVLNSMLFVFSISSHLVE